MKCKPVYSHYEIGSGSHILIKSVVREGLGTGCPEVNLSWVLLTEQWCTSEVVKL